MTNDGKKQDNMTSTVKEEQEESYESYYDEEEDADADPNEWAISKSKGAHFKGTIKNARASVAGGIDFVGDQIGVQLIDPSGTQEPSGAPGAPGATGAQNGFLGIIGADGVTRRKSIYRDTRYNNIDKPAQEYNKDSLVLYEEQDKLIQMSIELVCHRFISLFDIICKNGHNLETKFRQEQKKFQIMITKLHH